MFNSQNVKLFTKYQIKFSISKHSVLKFILFNIFKSIPYCQFTKDHRGMIYISNFNWKV